MGVVRGAAKGGPKATSTETTTEPSTDTTTEPSTSTSISTVNTDTCAVVEGGSPARANPYQWHLPLLDAVTPSQLSVERVTVAVLDTGVAYEDHADASGTYVQAPSLSDVAVVSPHDFVNGDAHANDDHQHGTHIASIIASGAGSRAWPPAQRSCRSRCSMPTTKAPRWTWWTPSTTRSRMALTSST